MILNCKEYRTGVEEMIKEEKNVKGISAFIQVGNREDSNVYIRQKKNACESAGLQYDHIHFEEDVTEEEVINKIKELNSYEDVVGIMVQLPLPKHINEDAVINAIAPEKDIDGFTFVNKGKLMVGEPTAIIPCTPFGILNLLEVMGFDLKGKNAVVVGRSNIVGKPMTQLLINAGATVTCCNSNTPPKKIKELVLNSDLFISAIDKADHFDIQYFGQDNLTKLNGVLAIDVGIIRVEGKLHGNISKELYDHFGAITPVPGGVGPMTVAGVLLNILRCNEIQRGLNDRHNN